MDNFALFTAGGRDFLVLNLEWEAPQYALDWADQGARGLPRPDRHHGDPQLRQHQRPAPRRPRERPGGTPPSTMWTDFVAQQCSIRLVLNGHFHDGDLGEANRIRPEPRAASPSSRSSPTTRIGPTAATAGCATTRSIRRPNTMTADDVLAETEPVRDRRRLVLHRCRSISARRSRPRSRPSARAPGRLRRRRSRHLDRSRPRHAVRVAGDRRRRARHDHLADLDGPHTPEQRPRRRHVHAQCHQRLGRRRQQSRLAAHLGLTSYSVDGSIGSRHGAGGVWPRRHPDGSLGTDVRVTADVVPGPGPIRVRHVRLSAGAGQGLDQLRRHTALPRRAVR